LIKLTRAIVPKNDAVYPPWQGMQYMHNMFGGQAKLESLDNSRYPHAHWTSIRDVIAAS
jgi:hypothetical protein